MSDLPPGWHTDPENSAEYRYWDGSHWTDHRAPRHISVSGHRPVGALLSGTWRLMAANWRPLLVIWAVIVVVYLAGEQVVEIGYDRVFGDTLEVLANELSILEPAADGEDFQAVLDDNWDMLKDRLSSLGPGTVATGVALMAAGVLVAAAANIVEFASFGKLTVRRLDHRPAGAAASLLNGLRRLPRVVGVVLMLLSIWFAGLLAVGLLSLWSRVLGAVLGVVLCLTLLVALVGAAPLVLTAVMTAAVGPAEPSLPYAQNLLRGSYWATFGRFALAGVLYVIASIVLLLFAEFLGIFVAPLENVVAIVVSVFPEMLFSIACFTIYHDLGGEHADRSDPTHSPAL